jgi:hypothetical protein
MFSFAALFFFAVTGITLNHPDWLKGEQKVEQLSGKMDPAWLSAGDSGAVAKLEIVEYLRNTHKIKAGLSDFRTEESECAVSFAGPGYAADAFISRAGGSYDITISYAGSVAVMNDLHKGRDTGSAWALVIDISAVLMVVVSLTGFIMIFFITKRKSNGLMIAVLGTILFVILCYVLI